jgi:hypothetical protein
MEHLANIGFLSRGFAVWYAALRGEGISLFLAHIE